MTAHLIANPVLRWAVVLTLTITVWLLTMFPAALILNWIWKDRRRRLGLFALIGAGSTYAAFDSTLELAFRLEYAAFLFLMGALIFHTARDLHKLGPKDNDIFMRLPPAVIIRWLRKKLR